MSRTRRLSIAISAMMITLPAMARPAGPTFERFSYSGRTAEKVVVGPHEYRNPILSGYYPDPSVTRGGDDFFLVNSSFAHFPGLPVFKSRDLVNWVQIGNAVDRVEQVDLANRAVSQGLFAPDISYHAGTFYIANTCVGCKGNFVITARDPAGPWSNPIWLPFEGIDPSIYWEGDRAFIVNNRDPAEKPRYEGHKAIWVQEYDWRAGKMVGASTQLVNGGVDLTKQPIWIEGPHLFKRDGFYYLIAAEGGTGANHSQVVFRARDLRGPYIAYAGNPILTQRDLQDDRANPITAAGHAKFVEARDGSWWATFLATRPYAPGKENTGRETFLLPVTWRDGWPHVLDHGRTIPYAAKRPDLTPAPSPVLPTSGDFAFTDEFDGASLGMQWVGIRAAATPLYRLGHGALVLGSGAPLGDISGVPAFLGRRQQHAIATVSTTLRFVPDREGARAGLAAVQSDRSYVIFAVTRIGGKAAIALYTRDLAATETLVASAPIDPTGPLVLTVRIDRGRMAFDYAARGKRHTLKSDLDATLLSTGRAGGFVGTVIGPYSFAPSR